MLCDKCNKNQATVHLKNIINGKKYEQHLCGKCAGDEENSLVFDDMFKNIFNMKPVSSINNSGNAIKCKRCGLTLNELNRYGRLGCSQCCESFAEYLEPALKNIHSVTTHKGKRSENSAVKELPQNKVASLKEKLKEAIKNEEYEKAAELRDIIREIEKEA